MILVACLLATLGAWWSSEKSLSVSDVRTTKGEIFYWTAILFSNTLGTALGDFLSDDSGLGFLGGAALIGGLLGLVVLGTYFTRTSRVLLFWIAFVLTRPFGATFGDLLTKPAAQGGLNFGTLGSSLILAFLPSRSSSIQRSRGRSAPHSRREANEAKPRRFFGAFFFLGGRRLQNFLMSLSRHPSS